MKAAQMEAFIEVYSASESPEKVIAALEQIQFVGAYYYLYAFRNFEINAPTQFVQPGPRSGSCSFCWSVLHARY